MEGSYNDSESAADISDKEFDLEAALKTRQSPNQPQSSVGLSRVARLQSTWTCKQKVVFTTKLSSVESDRFFLQLDDLSRNLVYY